MFSVLTVLDQNKGTAYEITNTEHGGDSIEKCTKILAMTISNLKKTVHREDVGGSDAAGFVWSRTDVELYADCARAAAEQPVSQGHGTLECCGRSGENGWAISRGD